MCNMFKKCTSKLLNIYSWGLCIHICAPRLHHFCFWIKSCVQMTNLCSRMCAACVPWVKWHNSKTVHQFMATDNKQSANYSSYWSCIICPTELLICACKFTECKIQCTDKNKQLEVQLPEFLTDLNMCRYVTKAPLSIHGSLWIIHWWRLWCSWNLLEIDSTAIYLCCLVILILNCSKVKWR